MTTWALPVSLVLVALTCRRQGYRPENVALMAAGWLLITLASLGAGGPLDVRTVELAVSGGTLGGVLYTWGAMRQNGGRWRRSGDEDR